MAMRTKNITSMPFQHLYNLPTLKVPDVNLPVFTPTNDVHSIRNTKARGNAIRSIQVARICLQASRRIIIP